MDKRSVTDFPDPDAMAEYEHREKKRREYDEDYERAIADSILEALKDIGGTNQAE